MRAKVHYATKNLKVASSAARNHHVGTAESAAELAVSFCGQGPEGGRQLREKKAKCEGYGHCNSEKRTKKVPSNTVMEIRGRKRQWAYGGADEGNINSRGRFDWPGIGFRPLAVANYIFA